LFLEFPEDKYLNTKFAFLSVNKESPPVVGTDKAPTLTPADVSYGTALTFPASVLVELRDAANDIAGVSPEVIRLIDSMSAKVLSSETHLEFLYSYKPLALSPVPSARKTIPSVGEVGLLADGMATSFSDFI
jgi:hypothetical protein